jgi:hypothetical protein
MRLGPAQPWGGAGGAAAPGPRNLRGPQVLARAVTEELVVTPLEQRKISLVRFEADEDEGLPKRFVACTEQDMGPFSFP